jgi:hypothetical protein
MEEEAMKSKNINNKQCVFSLSLLIVILLVVGPVFGQEAGEELAVGVYKLNRAPAPVHFVTGVALKKLSHANFPGMALLHQSLNGKFGRIYSLFNPATKRQVKISAAVYGNVVEAENAALEFLNTMSGLFKTGSQSGPTIGTHSWFMVSPTGSGSIVFVHNNSLFYVNSPDYSNAESSALQILKDLQTGKNGIQLGRQVLLPKITNVKLPDKIKRGIQKEIVMEGEDPGKRKLDYFVSTSTGQVGTTVKPGVKMYNTERAGADELKVYAINDLNVVSEVYVKKVEIEEDK